MAFLKHNSSPVPPPPESPDRGRYIMPIALKYLPLPQNRPACRCGKHAAGTLSHNNRRGQDGMAALHRFRLTWRRQRVQSEGPPLVC
jgi:hypothetical protein